MRITYNEDVSSDTTPNVASITVGVEDTGMGISKENQVLLFQPYSQIGANTTQNGVGTGLGLSFAKRYWLLIM